MIHRLFFSTFAAWFMYDAAVFLSCGIVMHDWRCAGIGIVETLGVVVLVVVGVD